MVTLTQSPFTLDGFKAFLSEREEPSWVHEARREAWAAFQDMPLPERTQEEWARTDIRGFRLEQYGFPVKRERVELPLALLSEGVDLAGSVATLDSQPASAWGAEELAARGVIFDNLENALRRHGARLQPYLFGRTVDTRADKFAALHAAAWHGGGVLFVPRGVRLEKPLHFLSALSPGGVDLTHQLVVLEEGAEATVLAETASLDPAGAGLHCGAIEIVVGPSARLRYVNLQNWGTGVWHFAQQKAIVGHGGSLQWTVGALGSRVAKVNQHVFLAGIDAETQVNGVMFTEGKQHLSYHTLQHHEAPHCRSDLLYKGALQDKSRIVWRGMIRVDRDAQKTDGYQRNDSLILSPDARADSIPGLEILADDVKCTHGATAGRVDDEMLFYLGTRGLTRKEAARMIVAGFFQQVFDRVTIESVRHALAEAIGRRVREYQL